MKCKKVFFHQGHRFDVHSEMHDIYIYIYIHTSLYRYFYISPLTLDDIRSLCIYIYILYLIIISICIMSHVVRTHMHNHTNMISTVYRHIIVLFFLTLEVWSSLSKKVTTHPWSTPQAIPLPNYERIPFTTIGKGLGVCSKGVLKQP